jgi:hypothetical protein
MDKGGFSTGKESGRDVKPITPLCTAELRFIRIKWGGEPFGWVENPDNLTFL